MNNIDVFAENIPEPPWLNNIYPFMERLLEKLEIEDWEFSIILCDDLFIGNLNREYRGKDSPTDVLTFAQDDEALPFKAMGEGHYAGDIVISLDTLGKNAKYFGVEEEEELKRLLIHGLLHLMGMNHIDNSPEQAMLLCQEKLIMELVEVKIFNK